MTWIPPAHRQPGQGPPPPPPRHRAVFPVAGAAGTAASVVLAGFLTMAFSFFHSVCNDTSGYVASQRDRLRVDTFVIWVICAGGPGVIAGLAKVRSRSVVPWVVAAATMIVVGSVISLTIQPGTFCLF